MILYLIALLLLAARSKAYVLPHSHVFIGPAHVVSLSRSSQFKMLKHEHRHHGTVGVASQRHKTELLMSDVGQPFTTSSVDKAEFSFIDGLLHNPVFWSISIMATIVALLYIWDEAVETAREKSPPAIQVVIDRILAEIGGLGFIGLVLSLALNKFALGDVVGQASAKFLGSDDILLEAFESLHETFFQAGILFFAAYAVMLMRVLTTLERISAITEECIRQSQQHNATEGDKISMESYESMLKKKDPSKNRSKHFSPWRRELSLTNQERGAEALVIRERLVREMHLGDDFRIEKYLENMFATSELDLVAISPLSWVPLIPALAAANGVDLEHDVVSVESINAAASSGYFLATPWVFLPICAIQALKFIWGALNFWKMAAIKDYLIPELVQVNEEQDDGETTFVTRISPPLVESAQARREFDSTPAWVRPIETMFRTQEPQNRVQELFGTVGGSGLPFYLNSIKFHTWLCVTSIVVYASQIIPRDLYALLHADTVQIGLPDLLVPELAVYGTFALLNMLELLVAPTTFLNFCLISCVEDMVQQGTDEEG